MFGRRPDGIRIKRIDPVMRITPYIMPMRCDAQVFLKYRADLEVLLDYIRRQRLEKNEQISYMQIIAAAYVRAISRNPQVNRYIMNKQLFARNNCSCAFTILKDPHDIDRGEAVVKIRFDLTDTIYDVRDRMNAAIAANRIDQEPGFVDKLLKGVFAVPGLATVIVALVRFLDRYGLAPAVLMDELPFYVGLYITNMASLQLQDVNHHLYNWGSVGIFAGMGLEERSGGEGPNAHEALPSHRPDHRRARLLRRSLRPLPEGRKALYGPPGAAGRASGAGLLRPGFGISRAQAPETG